MYYAFCIITYVFKLEWLGKWFTFFSSTKKISYLHEQVTKNVLQNQDFIIITNTKCDNF
jgi:hypothetical protein